MALQFRRGTSGERLAGFVPAVAEPIYDSSQSVLYVGDGVTPGGVPAGATNQLGDIKDVDIPVPAQAGLVNIEIVGGVLSITTGSPHGISASESFTFVSTSHPELTGTVTAATIPDATTITVNGYISDFGVISDGGYTQKTGYALSNGGYLLYDTASQQWRATEPPAVGNSILVYDTGIDAWVAKTYTLSELGDVDVATVPPANGWTLAWNGSQWVPENGTARNAFARGDGGDFTNGSMQGFVLGVYGAGDFTNTTVDEPVELNSGHLDGGLF